MKTWDDLEWWLSRDATTVSNRLDKGNHYPERELIYASMDECPFPKVKVVLCGQDPYPGTYVSKLARGVSKPYATGLSFSIPVDAPCTPSLRNIFKEYCSDLHYSQPISGDLSTWAKQGVLLWNAYLSCHQGSSLSHRWVEWERLTQEVFQVLSKRSIVFILLGAIPRQFSKYIDEENAFVIEAPHPMSDNYKNTVPRPLFKGSRIFSKTNDLLCSVKQEPVDWRLP